MLKINKKLVLRANDLIKQTRENEELNHILNMYILNPTKEYELALEVYCDLLEISIELDKQEEKRLVR